MLTSLQEHSAQIIVAFWETNFMMALAMVLCLIFSLPFGLLLYALREDFLLRQRGLYQLLSILLNTIRSVPFLLLIFILIPISRALFTTAFGNLAATLPLALVAISIYSRFVEQACLNVPRPIIDRAISMGATRLQILRYFILPSIGQDLILSLTSVAISVLSYSTVMGVIGAGGLGEFAFRYGYQEYDYPLMYVVIIIFVIYVYIIQSLGYFLAHRIATGRRRDSREKTV